MIRTFAPKQNRPQNKASFDLTRPGVTTSTTNHEAQAIPPVQRTLNSQAGQGLLSTSAASHEVCSGSPLTTRFAHDFSRIPVSATTQVMVQAKLAVSVSGDLLEQEADHLADHVMRMPERQSQHACASGGGCPQCQNKQDGYVHLQTKSIPSDETERTVIDPIAHEVLRHSGQPLDSVSRMFMESRFGHDFSRVRVHTDARAAEGAQALKAQAFTIGHNIVFGAGHYSPHDGTGKWLLAHELAHVVQQSAHGLALHRRTDNESGDDDGGGGRERDSDEAAQCTPYPTQEKGLSVRKRLLKILIPALRAIFGPDNAELYLSYLSRKKGDSLAPRVFNDPSGQLVQGFTESKITKEHQDDLVREVVRSLDGACPTLPLPPNEWISIPISEFRIAAYNLKYPINYSLPRESPGNVAGGLGESDAGKDLREVSGYALFYREVDHQGKTKNVKIRPDLDFYVKDAVDFCPGGAGNFWERQFTVPMSRLEASDLAYDMPFEVYFKGPAMKAKNIPPYWVNKCWPNPPAGSEATSPAKQSGENKTKEGPTRKHD